MTGCFIRQMYVVHRERLETGSPDDTPAISIDLHQYNISMFAKGKFISVHDYLNVLFTTCSKLRWMDWF